MKRGFQRRITQREQKQKPYERINLDCSNARTCRVTTKQQHGVVLESSRIFFITSTQFHNLNVILYFSLIRTGPTKKILKIYAYFGENLDRQNFERDCWNPVCAL